MLSRYKSLGTLKIVKGLEHLFSLASRWYSTAFFLPMSGSPVQKLAQKSARLHYLDCGSQFVDATGDGINQARLCQFGSHVAAVHCDVPVYHSPVPILLCMVLMLCIEFQ